MRTTTLESITSLKPSEVFVFGSNLAGRHDAGAAKLAFEKFGAVYHQGIGHFGRSYALPTLDENLRRLPLSEIKRHVGDFVDYASEHPGLTFLVTKIGCGIAGFTPHEIGLLFFYFPVPLNVTLPKEFSGRMPGL